MKVSLRMCHINRDLKEVKEGAMQNIWQGKKQMQSPEAGACLVYLRNSREGSVAGWDE